MILACRSTEKAESAKRQIESTLPDPVDPSTIQVWPLDLCSFESIQEFCRRAETTLDRLDVVLANAAVLMTSFVAAVDAGGYESTVATNVVSTFLMAVMLLPKLRQTAVKYNTTPSLTFVVSDSHMWVSHQSFPAQRRTDERLHPHPRFAGPIPRALCTQHL